MKRKVRTMDILLVCFFVVVILISLAVVEYNLVSVPTAVYFGEEEVTAAFHNEMESINAILEPYDLCFSEYGEIEIDGIDAAEMENVLQIDENTELMLRLQCRGYNEKENAFAIPGYTLWVCRTKDTDFADASFLDEYPYIYEIAAHLSGTLSEERFRGYCEKVYDDVYAELERDDSNVYDVFGTKEKHLPSMLKLSGYVDFTIQRASEYGEAIYIEGLGDVVDSVPIDAYEKTLLISDYWRSND